MIRLFDEHLKRECISLDGSWKQLVDRDDIGEKEKYFNGLPNAKATIVPSVWNTELGMLEYEGVVWYEKKIHVGADALRLYFGAVMTYAKVYFDGEYLGDHYGSHTAFSFIVENVAEGEHTVTVKVDNRFDRIALPNPLVDWYHYDGIIRTVCAQKLSGISVLGAKFDYELTDGLAICKVSAKLYNASDAEITDKVLVCIDDNCYPEMTVTLKKREVRTVVIENLEFKAPRRWSPDSPTLYTLLVKTSTDDLYDRVGFRTVEVKGREILLNGKKLRLRGVNRHEEHPDFGMAFPTLLMQRDIEIVESAGCNTLRGSHYPNNPIFLDMLDERGIIFWSEIPMWGSSFDLEDENFINRGLNMHKEMVEQYYNHPSILIWGMFNEIKTPTEPALAIAKKYYKFLRENGGQRLVTFASSRPLTDICLKECDFISFNAYIGWYDYEYDTWESFLEAIENYLKTVECDNKPVVMSEFGAAAIYGNHTFDNLRWTEEYQSELVSHCIKLFFSKEWCAGTYVWQYADIRTSKEMGLTRARNFNNKGILNEYRKPKLAYLAVKELYEKIKKEDE